MWHLQKLVSCPISNKSLPWSRHYVIGARMLSLLSIWLISIVLHDAWPAMAGPVQVHPLVRRFPSRRRGDPTAAYALDNDSDDDAGPSPRAAASLALKRRPYECVDDTKQQPIPPMRVVQRLTQSKRLGGSGGPLDRQAVLEVRARPPGYRPLLADRAPPRTPPIMPPQLPALQLLPSCEQFEGGWSSMLSLLNEYRQSVLGPDYGLCMNARLMEAAKLQSDFQGLAKVPTHAGPQMAGFGSLEDRLIWFGFGNVSGNIMYARSKGPNDGGDRPPCTDDNPADDSVRRPFAAAEVIHYWPVGPRILPPAALEGRLREAMAAWKASPHQASILSARQWNFFGYGYYRGRNGATYLTLILASSPFEVCHVCPTARTRARLTRHLEQAAPWTDEYDNLFS